MEKKERNHNSYCELPEGEDVSSSSPAKRESRKGKENREIRILKKGKSIKDQRNDPERFSGEGVWFRAKIIGTEHVLDARGNRMCQGALQRLKAAVKTSGDHKQKIILNISLDGIIIKDEKSGEQLHHHPIHKISFISQDTKDSRAFGYVYGCPQTGHRFFAIKTEKAASQVVVTLRDLFLVALELKKSEIERTHHSETPEDIPESIQDGEEKNNHENGVSNGSLEAACQENIVQNHSLNPAFLYSNMVLLPEEFVPERKEASPVNTLLDLQTEMDILQQGISQMDHSIAFAVSHNLGISFSEDDVSESSTSSVPATSFHFKLDKLSSLYQETLSVSSRSSSTSDYNVCVPESKAEDHDTPRKDPASLPEPCSSGISSLSTTGSNSTVSEEAASVVEDKYAVFLDIDLIPSIFDDPSIVKMPEEKVELPVVSSSTTEVEPTEIKSSTPIAFAELDPLGDHPYVDKRDFFQDIKNPPKKVLNDLVGTNCDSFPVLETDVPCSMQENMAFCDLKSRNQDNAFTPGISSAVADPPKLPPKRSAGIFSEQQHDSTAWDSKNPFNPFLCEEYPDIPPPSSPPPPPPPRLPTKILESSPTLSPPPPRPPSRVNGVPTPPLPKRKVPLSSANRTWFSFDQDAAAAFPPTPFNPEAESTARYAPPLPSPARKFPSSKPDSPLLLKSSSASNSPATLRRLFNKSPQPGISIVAGELDTKVGSAKYSPKRILSRHSSIMQDNDAFIGEVINPFMESRPEVTLESSPPLPPKPSPLRRGDIPVSSCSSSGVSAIESSNGTPHSSSSLVYSSLDEGRVEGSSSEALFTNSTDSGSDVFSQSSKETVQPQSSSDSTTLEKSMDVSPDSIFRRKSDPFADDFFLSLHKKDSLSITGCSNGIEHLDNVREPT